MYHPQCRNAKYIDNEVLQTEVYEKNSQMP